MTKNSKLFLWAMMILPLLSLPLIGKESLKRYMPSGFFSISIMAVLDHYAEKRKWWLIYEKLHSNVPGIIPFLVPFFVGSIWIMKWTYGKFIRFKLLNLVVDSFFIFVFVKLLKKSGIASIVKLKEIHVSLLFFIQALMLYGFQLLKEKTTNTVPEV
ncbi:hypothetical protein V1502_11070 [Bacillus sp. SCS-153A]|uniref:hypothetical protein n=1 Tax=Rossellomorea sedimentorum TaxID=3115294 RepID=UPI00390617F4